jgi:ABC-type transporter Mla subunit MlaD
MTTKGVLSVRGMVAPLFLLLVIAACESGGPLRLRARFRDLQRLRSGALVQISGVPVGKVTGIRAVPDEAGLSEITLDFPGPAPPLPKDARARLVRAAGSGECFVELDLARTRGGRARNDDLLPSE